MNEQIVSLIDRLAERLGVTATELMRIYVERAPYEWTEAILGWIFFVLVVGGFVFMWRARDRSEREEKNAEPYWIGTMLFALGGVIIGAVAVGETIEAVKATGAPGAYAFDHLIGVLRGLK